jgi:hypothetical protein
MIKKRLSVRQLFIFSMVIAVGGNHHRRRLGYGVDPMQCAKELAANSGECLFAGAVSVPRVVSGTQHTTVEMKLIRQWYAAHESDSEPPCVKCLFRRPGVRTWGCTLGQMREWCILVSEEAPADIIVEAHSSKAQREVKALRKNVNTGILGFAKQLVKFDNANPQFVSQESSIVNDMIVHNVTERHALEKLKHPPQNTYKKMKQAFMQKLKTSNGWGTYFLKLPVFQEVQAVQAADLSSRAFTQKKNKTTTPAPPTPSSEGSAAAESPLSAAALLQEGSSAGSSITDASPFQAEEERIQTEQARLQALLEQTQAEQARIAKQARIEKGLEQTLVEQERAQAAEQERLQAAAKSTAADFSSTAAGLKDTPSLSALHDSYSKRIAAEAVINEKALQSVMKSKQIQQKLKAVALSMKVHESRTNNAPTKPPTKPPTDDPTKPPTVSTFSPTSYNFDDDESSTNAPTNSKIVADDDESSKSVADDDESSTNAPTKPPTKPPTDAPTKSESVADYVEDGVDELSTLGVVPTNTPTHFPTIPPTRNPTIAAGDFGLLNADGSDLVTDPKAPVTDMSKMHCDPDSCTVCKGARAMCCSNFIFASGQCQSCVKDAGCDHFSPPKQKKNPVRAGLFRTDRAGYPIP